jgi:hypothetical protein
MRSRTTRLALPAIALTATALLQPALTAAPADAAGRPWDRLAHCESGGRWHVATGNGYYGGLQFSAGTWRAFGGGKYASLAHRASRTQQIRIAERVQDAQGWGAWPSCSRQIGLR